MKLEIDISDGEQNFIALLFVITFIGLVAWRIAQ